VKRVAVLGSTGSIGAQTLDVISQHPDRLQVVGLAARRNAGQLQEQAARFGVKRIALYEDHPDIPCGMNAVVDVAAAEDVDVVVVSVAGVIGLVPTIEAIQAGKHIALASKEVLVAAGEIVMPLIVEHGVHLTPIDSEHSAIFQCLQGCEPGQLDALILTASGGPFRGKKQADLKGVTVEQALNHPTWRMGGKITIDSATLMNKGLEAIEARWLFGVPVDRVGVVIHPQSIVHSFVKFQDGSVLGQLGWPNMRLPIQYALLWPERLPNALDPWSPLDSPNLTFEPADEDTFRCLPIAREASRIGGTMPCAMNAANEEAANAFLRSEIGFLDIAARVESVMEKHASAPPTLEGLLETDAWARRTFLEMAVSRT
jgi:1-deoxy-D-xylulose-5-phosphate reductoisomerase